jgi:hypothetical protein
LTSRDTYTTIERSIQDGPNFFYRFGKAGLFVRTIFDPFVGVFEDSPAGAPSFGGSDFFRIDELVGTLAMDPDPGAPFFDFPTVHLV